MILKNKLLDRYRSRGIGEGIFGSLTNWLWDRLKTSLIASTIVRIGARVIACLARIYIRVTVFNEFLDMLVLPTRCLNSYVDSIFIITYVKID